MHTQITLDDQILQQAIELTGLTSPQDIIEVVLRDNQTPSLKPLANTVGKEI